MILFSLFFSFRHVSPLTLLPSPCCCILKTLPDSPPLLLSTFPYFHSWPPPTILFCLPPSPLPSLVMHSLWRASECMHTFVEPHLYLVPAVVQGARWNSSVSLSETFGGRQWGGVHSTAHKSELHFTYSCRCFPLRAVIAGSLHVFIDSFVDISMCIVSNVTRLVTVHVS